MPFKLPPPRPTPPALKIGSDMGPLFVFAAVYYWHGLELAIVLLIVLSILALAITYFFERKLSVMPLVTALIVFVMGSLTLILDNKQFFYMKPTIVNLFFALVLSGGLLAKKPILKILFGQALDLTEKGWFQLSLRWIGFFVFAAILNEYVWRNFSESTWVSFKVFGFIPLTILFTLAQAPFIMKHQLPDTDETTPSQ